MKCCLLWPLSAWVNKDINTYFTELREPGSETDNTSFQAARGAGRKFLEQDSSNDSFGKFKNVLCSQSRDLLHP